MAKVRNHPEHTVFLLVEGNAVVGLLKVGKKNLFMVDQRGEQGRSMCFYFTYNSTLIGLCFFHYFLNKRCVLQNEVYPLCVLDFYVHESRQRSGCGRRLFEAMLKRFGTHPRDFKFNENE